MVHSDRKSRPLKELDIIISITKRDDISTGNPEHFCDRFGPDRFIDVGRCYLQDFIFRADNIHLSSKPSARHPVE